MSELTYYVALPFLAGDDGVAAGEPTECFNPDAAVMRAEALSRKEGHVGAVAFSARATLLQSISATPGSSGNLATCPIQACCDGRNQMADIANDLKERFDWAMYQSQEAYVVRPDGRSFERSDRDEYAIGVFKDLYDSVDAMPLLLLEETEKLRSVTPEKFEEALVRGLDLVGFEFSPASATEFVESLNRTVQRDTACA
jgi:hypothetical protein